MSEESVQIYKSGQLVRMGGHLTDVVLSDNGSYEMFVMADGLAEYVSVGRQCTLTLEDGGVVDGLEVRVGGSCSVNGTASLLKQVELSGVVSVYNGGTVDGCTARGGSRVMAFRNSVLLGIALEYGAYLYVSSGSLLKDLSVSAGAELDITGARLENAVLSAGAKYDLSQCVLADCTLDGDFDAQPGTGLSVDGSLTINGRCKGLETLDFSNATLDFDLVGRIPAAVSFVNELPEAAEYGASVAEKQLSGQYALADDARGFNQTLALATDGDEPFTAVLAVGETAASENVRYGLVLDDGALSLTVANRQVLRLSRGTISAECDGGWWSVDTPAVSVYARQATAVAETRDWFAEDFSAAKTQSVEQADAPSRIIAEADGVTDLFLAEACGVWASSYQAQNTYTGELVALEGRNRLADIFIGAADHAVLMLTDDSDALFADDLFSALGDSRENRLQGLAEIHAGAGDDLVDLTCINVSPESAGCLLDGGDGDDILWGGETADVIIGGAGDDTLVSHRDGVQFLFGDGWGHDTVQVGDGLDFTLRFNEGTQLSINYDDFGARLSCGDDSVAVMGVFEGIEGHIAYGVLSAS